MTSQAKQAERNLDLGAIGNCAFGALIDRKAEVVWACLPRFDGDPIFNSLLGGAGRFAVEVEGLAETRQSYDANTAILRTELVDKEGQTLEVTDFAPRFLARGRVFRPLTLVRRLRPISGSPRIRILLRPRFDWGGLEPQLTHGSNHIRYVGSQYTLRLTTSAPVDYVRHGTPFLLDQPISLILGPDETLDSGVESKAFEFEQETANYWRTWSRRLAVPLEWQEAVIRAAITLKLCVFEETGAIVAALTSSLPEAADSGRTWDYRYCWLRDAFFVVRALNSLSEVSAMESYLAWLNNVISSVDGGRLQPVYGIGLESDLSEEIVDTLPGYRGMGPVRRGNQAFEHYQNDVYGNVILGATQAFLDARLFRPAGIDDFHRLERLGDSAFALYDQPDAGMWELRTRAQVHTSSSLMCWAACDRLAKIARSLANTKRARFWAKRAEIIRTRILDEAWNDKRGAFVDSFGGKSLDASVLLMGEVGFLPLDDPRFVSTVATVEKVLADGAHMRRYEAPDDFGQPETAFNICTFWRIDALARMGRNAEAREIFEEVLARRNHVGLLSEDVHVASGELWGNVPQTYSMVGIINGAVRLSARWETAI
jgi:GH15 family glucan-1,4-alpha-glucosidase